ncbi:riboflavin kinase [Actinoplanes sp. NPDC000266]
MIRGEVVHGAGRGRPLGFPTANLAVEDPAALPGDGVYLGMFALDGGPAAPALVSIGANPTFGGEVRTVEAYVLDRDEDMYGRRAELRILTLIREQERFDSAEALVEAMASDERAARRLLTMGEDAEERGWRRFGPDSIERAMLLALGEELGVDLRPRSIDLGDGTRLEIEGADEACGLLVQMVGNQGTFRSLHRNKVMADMFKLTWLRSSMFPESRIVLCVSATVAQVFSPAGWTTRAARDLGIEVLLYNADGKLETLVQRS